MKDKSIREKLEPYKHIIRSLVVLACVIGMVYSVWDIRNQTQQISSPDFSLENYVPDDFKPDKALETSLNNLDTVYIDGSTKIVTVPYNPISKAIWNIVNLIFYMFVLILVRIKSGEEEIKSEKSNKK
jgi:hypothetical protein